jgi:hypothetical protein
MRFARPKIYANFVASKVKLERKMRSFLMLAAIGGLLAGGSLFLTEKAYANPCGKCPPDKPYCVVGCGGPHCEPRPLEQIAPDGGICGAYTIYQEEKAFSVRPLNDNKPE